MTEAEMRALKPWDRVKEERYGLAGSVTYSGRYGLRILWDGQSIAEGIFFTETSVIANLSKFPGPGPHQPILCPQCHRSDPTATERQLLGLPKALDIALQAHVDQIDQQGKPYIGHLLRVAARVSDSHESMTVALLHDIVEDTYVTLTELREQGFPPAILDAVRALTKMPSETYFEYIEGIKSNPLALKVKLADLQDNLSPERRFPGDESLRERHLKALEILTQDEGL